MTATSAATSMRALVFTGPGAMELQTVSAPVAPPGWIELTVRASGICGSELHGFRSVGFRRPPLVMGHEFAGLTPTGQRVVVNPLISCGECDLCLLGQPELCRSRQLMGVHLPGGFAERVAVPSAAVLEIPQAMSWESAVLVEPLANAVHALRQIDVTSARRVAVIGAGTIGLVSLLVARHAGIDDVTVVDRSESRLELARRLGAASCVQALDGEFDAVVDAVGSAQTRGAAVEHTRPGGSSVWLGLAESDSGFDGNGLVRGEKRIVGSFAYGPNDFADALAMAPELQLDWATAVPLEDSQRVFLALADGAPDPVKAVIRL